MFELELTNIPFRKFHFNDLSECVTLALTLYDKGGEFHIISTLTGEVMLSYDEKRGWWFSSSIHYVP